MHQQRQRLALEQKVKYYIKEQGLVTSGQKLLAAVSGGSDSICLLHILAGLRRELGIKLYIAHLNHQLRDAESEEDAKYVTEIARQLNIPSIIESRDVLSYQFRQHISLEEAAREIRYKFLSQIAESISANLVATGHTIEDHMETILIHLIRGCGTRGLRGLQSIDLWPYPYNNLRIIRPLLAVSREETTNYCQHHRLLPRIDTSNLSLSPLRNRIRQQLLPLLKSYNPRIVSAFIRTARIIGDDFDLLNKENRRQWSKIARQQDNIIILDKDKFTKLPPAQQRHLLRISIEELSGNLKDIEARHIEEIMAMLNKPAGKRLNLPLGRIFYVDYRSYLLSASSSALTPFPVLEKETEINIPGTTLLLGWRIEAAILDEEGTKEEINDFKAYFDLNKTGNKLTVRQRKTGDRFQPLGMNRAKKLGEFMIDSKIPNPWRFRIPIVCSVEHILWVVGWRIDERAKVTNSTKQILCLEFKHD